MPCELLSTPEDRESSKEGPELGDDAAVLSQSFPKAVQPHHQMLHNRDWLWESHFSHLKAVPSEASPSP